MNGWKTVSRLSVVGLLAGLIAAAGLFAAGPAPSFAQQETPTPESTKRSARPDAETANAMLSLEPSKPTVGAGEEFDMVVKLSTDKASRATGFELSFDPAKVEVISLVEGDFYKQWADANGATTQVYPDPAEVIDNAQGKVKLLGVTIMGGPVGGPVGEGVVFTVKAKAKDKASGTAEFKLALVSIFDGGTKGVLMEYLETKFRDAVVTIGGGAAANTPAPVAVTMEPTPVKPTPRPTAVVREQTGPEAGNAGSFPWEIAVAAAAAVVLVGGVAVVMIRRRG